MELKQLVLATAAAFSAGAYAAGDYSSPPQRQSQSQSQSAMPSGKGSEQHAQAQSSDVVRQVQQELKQKGINAGPVDGQWGPLTEQGVRQFQKSQNLQTSGQLDEQTLAALGIQEQSSATGGSKTGGSQSGSSASGGPGSGNPAGSPGGSSGGSAGSR